MARHKVNLIVPIALLMMSSALMWHTSARDRYSEFGVGTLMGASSAMLVIVAICHFTNAAKWHNGVRR